MSSEIFQALKLFVSPVDRHLRVGISELARELFVVSTQPKQEERFTFEVFRGGRFYYVQRWRNVFHY